MALFTSWVARVRLARRIPAAALAQADASPPEQVVVDQAVSKPGATSVRSWLIVVLIMVGALVTLVLPSPVASIVLLLLVLMAMLVVVRDSDFSLRKWRLPVRGMVAGEAASAKQGRVFAFVQSHRRLFTIVFTLIAVLCMIGSAHEFRPNWEITDRTEAVLLMLIGGASLGLALLVAPYREPLMTPTDAPIHPPRAQGLVVLAGVALLALLVAINVERTDVEFLRDISTHAQFALWLLGVLLVVWGLSGMPRLRLPRIEQREALTLLLIAVLAFGVRVYHLDTAVRASIDEVHFMGGIRMLRDDPDYPLLRGGFYILPVTMMGSYFSTLGVTAVERLDLFGLRFMHTIVGTLNVLAVYGLCRALFSRRVAVAAALVCLALPLHIHFSRVNSAHMFDTLFGTLLVMFIARGLQTNRRIDWAFGGIALGLTQYFFEGGRLLFPPVVALWVIVLAISQWRRLRHHGNGLLICIVAALFTAAPVYYSLYATDTPRARRYTDSGVSVEYFTEMLQGGLDQGDIDQLLQRVTNPFLMYVNRSELVPQYFGGDQPIIPTIYVPLFLLGVFYLIWRWRSPSIIIVIWIVGTALGNSLLHDQWQSPRYVEVTPALAIAVAVGICYLPPLLLGSSRPPGRTMGVVTMAAAAIVGASMVGYYFGPHLRLFNTQFRQTKDHSDGVDAALRLVEAGYPPGTHILVIGDPELDPNVPVEVMVFHVGDIYDFQSYHSTDVDETFFQWMPHNGNYAFFVDPADRRIIDLIERHFEVEPPQYSPTIDLPPNREYILLYAPESEIGR
jgi:hypothetical protein